MKSSWLIVLLPLLIANYFFLVIRHEACHALVVWASGGQVTDFHVWPPAAGNLSWITEVSPGPRSAALVRLQAALPSLVSLAMLVAALYLLSGVAWRWRGFVRFNLVLLGVVFPLIDLALGVGGYWLGGGDYVFVFGRTGTGVALLLAVWVVILAGLSVWVVARTARPRGAEVSA